MLTVDAIVVYLATILKMLQIQFSKYTFQNGNTGIRVLY